MKYCYCVTAKIGHGGELVGWGVGVRSVGGGGGETEVEGARLWNC